LKILVLNCGSSSVKFQVFEMEGEISLARGMVEKIGTSGAILRYSAVGKPDFKETQEVLTHERAIDIILSVLMHQRYGVIKNKEEIDGVGHRVVHGAEKFSCPVLLTDEVIRGIAECIRFAPLHNPHNLKGIEATRRLLPDAIQVGVFDTAFHHRMPQESCVYGIPYALYSKLGIRRYGFHGPSHQFVSSRAAELMGRPLEELRLITCHLGNGCSMAAIRGGFSIDTSMGFTPLEGLLMGTRCGDIDPALIPFIQEQERLSTAEITDLLYRYSGLKGISETSSDMREIEEEAREGSPKHILALNVFCHRVRKYIGAYAAELGGVDAIVFTGGIGENSWTVREKSLQGLDFMGISIDPEKNRRNEDEIGTGSVRVFVIKTDEELVIARETRSIIERLRRREIDEGITDLTREEKAELVLLWAKNSRASISDLARILSQRLNREIDEITVSKELKALGLLVRPA